MKLRGASCGVVVAAVLGWIACGGGGGAGSADAFITSYCNLFVPCCQQADLRSDGQQCRAFFGAFTSAAHYDSAAGQACLDDVKAASSRGEFCSGAGSNGSAACARVFTGMGSGTKQPGESCDDDGDCAPAPAGGGKAKCASQYGSGATVRSCQIQVTGKLGDQPCVGTVVGNSTYSNSLLKDVPATGYLCKKIDGLRCDSISNACVALKAVGEACTSSGLSGDCVVEAYCDGQMKKCVARKDVGATCGAGYSSDECKDATYCAPTKLCAAQLAPGEACSSSSQCNKGSCVNSKCQGAGTDNLGLVVICGTK